MQESDQSVRVWDWPVRLFHWLLVLTIAMAFLSSEEDSALHDWHILSGWIAAILIVFRLVWGFVGGEHSRFSDFIRPSRIAGHLSGLLGGRTHAELGHNPLGAIAVVILLALTGAVVWTGAFGGEAAEDLHELIAWTLLAMIALHVVAVLLMSLVERESLVRAMITGEKRAARHPGAVDARPPSAPALAIAGLVIAGTVYLILGYDPQGFTLRSAEAFEHRADREPARQQREDESDEAGG